MTSAASGRIYRVFVQRPTSAPPPTGWPVMVVTDANATFASAASAERIGELAGRAALIVGVGYPVDDARAALALRNRDLTPATPLAGIRRNPGQPPPRLEDYGGAEAFYRFLVDELRPRIAASYPVDGANQTLYGHSFGGLFTLGVLFAHPDAYRGFVISSPSIWWNDRAVLKGEPAFTRAISSGAIAPRILVLVGGREQEPATGTPPPGVTREELARLAADSRMVDNARELDERLRALKGSPGYAAGYHAFEGEDHISVIPASVARGLAFAEGAAP